MHIEYFLDINLSKIPLVTNAVYISPCPGGHHSRTELEEYSAGLKSSSINFRNFML